MVRLLFILIVFASIGCTAPKEPSKLQVGVPSAWGELVPALQHTAFADAILSNQYEPLVKIGSDGLFKPLAAKSWKISPDFTTFEFKIDTTKMFSNGNHLSAKHFKECWEYALTLIPKSTKSSLRDVLYKVDGFENFGKSKSLAGLQAPDDETFIIKFQKPFRTGLVYLAGARMAVFLKEKDHFLGTGPYMITTQKTDETTFAPNKFSKVKADFDEVTYSVVSRKDADRALKDGKIQMYIFASNTKIDGCDSDNSNIACYTGSASRHMTMIVNGSKGYFAKRPNFRLALQSLVYKNLDKAEIPVEVKNSLLKDSQIFLPVQSGRLPDEKANSLVSKGEKHINAFLTHNKSNPIRMKVSPSYKWLYEYLKSLEINLTKDSGVVEPKEIVQIYYKTGNADLMSLGIAVVSGDPDGIYHALGRDGSISSKMTYRKHVADLLEQGREILQTEKLNDHYQKVSNSILAEVPFVHLGFTRTRVAYRGDLIKVKSNHKRREDDRLITFMPR